MRGHRDPGPVRGRCQPQDATDLSRRERTGGCLLGVGDPQRIGRPGGLVFAGHVFAGDVGHPAGTAEHARQTGTGCQVNADGAGGAVFVREPVDGAAHLDHAGLARPVALELTQVIRRGHHVRGAAGRWGAERNLDPSRPGSVQAVQQPDLAGHVVHHAFAVGAGVSCVPAVVVGVAAQTGAVQRAGVDVPRALVVADERHAPADQHRAGELGGQVGQDAGERLPIGRCDPDPARCAATVALPLGGLAAHPAGHQRGGRPVLRQGRDGAERQPPRCLTRGNCPGHGDISRLTGGTYREHLAGRRPPADHGRLIAPVGKAGGIAAVGSDHVDLGGAVAEAGPGDL